jgi:carbon-monoxide dehydrogenase small subunit
MKPVALSLTVNDKPVHALVDPRTHLADFLRDQLRLTGTHLGCEHGVCGSCTVLINGAPVRGCISYAVAFEGANVRTIEGFSDDKPMASLREAFSQEHALQCGFCTPGMLITARDIVMRLGNVDEHKIRTELSGNLCRCTGYRGIVRAVKAVASGASQSCALSIAPDPLPAREGLPSFAPVPLASSSAASRPSKSEGRTDSWTRFEETFTVHASLDEVWTILSDFPVVASCLPGAEIGEYDSTSVKGRLRVKLGPISAAFAGAATIVRDEPNKSAQIIGAGSDSASRSRTRGELAYRLRSEADDRTRVLLEVRYDIQGMLGQFARSGLAQELGRRMVIEFASNLDAHLGSREKRPTISAPLATKLIRSVLWARIRALLAFRRSP